MLFYVFMFVILGRRRKYDKGPWGRGWYVDKFLFAPDFRSQTNEDHRPVAFVHSKYKARLDQKTVFMC